MAPVEGNDHPLNRIVIVNTTDRGGGAERVVMSMLDGFEELGTETWLAVGAKRTEHPRVVPFHSNPHVDYRPHADPAVLDALEARRRLDRRLGLEDYNHPYTHHLLSVAGPPPDVVLCNNLHGGFFDLRFLSRLSRRVPVVLLLSDCWTFTGHCAFPLNCSRWQTGCGSCPDLTIPPAIERDATATNWRRKKAIFTASRVSVITPSRWLMEWAQRSLLAPAIESQTVVPNGIDLDVFAPGSRLAARRRLGLDPDATILLSVVNLGAANPYKDFHTLRAALQRLAGESVTRPLQLLVVGQDGPPEQPAEGVEISHLPYCESSARLGDLYRAADVLAHAVHEEPFGLVAAEALACGIPVVAAGEGGIGEVVDDGRTGVLVPPRRPALLAAALQSLVDDPGRRARMGAAGAKAARDRFDRRRMVADVHAWCAEIAASRGVLGTAYRSSVPGGGGGHAVPGGDAAAEGRQDLRRLP
jgi:glycosyltransferase involved in cell wall biosynthesis